MPVIQRISRHFVLEGRESTPVLFQKLALFPLPVTFFLSIALVILFLAFGKADFTFDPALGIVQVEWDQGIAGTFDLADQLADLISMEQQFAVTDRIRLDMGGSRCQWADMGSEKIDFPTTDDDIGFFELNTSRTDGFDLPTFQDHASLMAFFDKIIMEGFFIVSN